MKLEFTVEQLRILDKALQSMPYFEAAPLIQSINAQLQKAHDAAEDARHANETESEGQANGRDREDCRRYSD